MFVAVTVHLCNIETLTAENVFCFHLTDTDIQSFYYPQCDMLISSV